MQIGQNTTFTQIYNQMKPGLLTNQDKHLRLTGTDLHTHNSLMAHGKGAAALQARLAKYDNAATAIHSAIARQYTPEIADRVFRNLGLSHEVTLRHLRQIKAEIERETTVDLGKYHAGAAVDRDALTKAAVDGSDGPLAYAFDAWARSGLSDTPADNMAFLRAVHDYRQNPAPDKAKAIIAEFIDGSRRINPTDKESDARKLFDQAKKALDTDSAQPDAFDRLYEEVFDMMSLDVMPRFFADQQAK